MRNPLNTKVVDYCLPKVTKASEEGDTPEHIDAVMSVFRRTIWDEIQNIIHTLDECLLDISSGFEQEEEEPQD